MPTLDVAINALRAKHGAQQFDTAVKKIKRGSKEVDKSTKSNEKSFKSLGTQMKTVVTGMVGMAAAYKGLRFAQTAVKEAATFGMELANVSTMLDGQTMHYLPGYEKELSNLAVKYGQSTATLSKGLYDILSASIDAGDAIEVLEVASRSAIGGLTDTGTAADALTTIINAYGMGAKDAGKISDILFATVKRGKINFGELAGSIGKVVAIAAAAGLSFEQMSAGIATMTRSGINADMAMTALKAIVTAFMSPAKEAATLAKDKFGLAMNTATLQTIGLTGAMALLKDATAEETAVIFPNVRALLGVSAARKSLNALTKDYEGILKSTGMQEIAYQKIAATTQQQLNRNRELWKQIKRDIGQGIQPEVDLWLQGMQLLVKDWREGWQSMSDAQRRAQEEIEKNMGSMKYLRLIPAFKLIELGVKKAASSQTEFIGKMLLADDAIKELAESTEILATGLEKIDKIKFEAEIASMDTKELTEADKKLVASKKEAGIAVSELFNELAKENELIGLTNEERERAIKLAELEGHAKIILGDKSGELVDAYKTELKELQKAYDLDEFYGKIEEGMGGLLRSPLTALLDETRDIGDVLEDELKNLGQSILESMYEEMITTPLKESIMGALKPVFSVATSMLSELLGGIAGGITKGIGGMIGMAIPALFGAPATAAAKGNIFSGGVKPFAKGDILTSPTIFPMSNGGVGLAAEAGSEAIMPLGRDNQGRLGVRTDGDGESSKTPLKIINVMDYSMVQEYLNSGDGERTIVNIMSRNANEIQSSV